MRKSFVLPTLLVFIFISTFSNNAFSQKKQPKFGKISLDRVKEPQHATFPDAHAVKLFDYGATEYVFYRGTGLQATFERHVAIKFYDQEKLDFATFEIALSHNRGLHERISGIKAVTYNMDDRGKFSMTKLDKKDVLEEQVNEYRELKKFTLPQVKEGSVIEVKYTVTSDFYTSMEPWTFQSFIPTEYSEYSVNVPEFFIFNKNFTGFLSPSVIQPEYENFEGYRSKREKWVMENIPAFQEENYMRSYLNYISRIDFELRAIDLPRQPTQNFSKTWDGVRENLMASQNFGHQLNKGGAVADIAELAPKGGGDMDRLVTIYEHVKRSMKWNNQYSEFSRNGIKKAYDKKEGTSGDINLLLIAALRKAGFTTYPVVLSTRNRGMLPISNPSLDKLNYVIAAVELDGEYILMDATEDERPMHLLPTRCFNGDGKLIAESFVKNIKITPTDKYKSVAQFSVALSEDGTLSGTILKTKSGYAALDFRMKMARANDEEDFIKRMEDAYEGLNIESHEFENLNDIYKNIKESYEVSLEDKAEIAGDFIYLNPMLIEGTKENPFKLETRQYPVDFAVPIEETYVLQLTIPEGYVIESLPEKTMVVLPEKACQFIYSVSNKGNQIQVTSRIKISKVVYDELQYQQIKEFFNLIIQKQSEQIVLKKS